MDVGGLGRRRKRLKGRFPPNRTTGVIVLVLFFGATAVSLAVAYLYRLGVAQALVTVLVGGGAPAGLYLAWAGYRDDRRERSQAGALNLAEVADQLAAAVAAQWREETAIRRLNQPYPLPVSWTAADDSLADTWDVLVRLAMSGAGWPPPRLPATWAAGPAGLAGQGGELVRVLARVPTGRLAVLGEPGSGKTVLMIRLVLDLLARRRSGGPVPVLASLASWNPDRQDLRGWLSTQLTLDYPALALTGEAAGSRAASLLAAGLILPILDGLDEVPDALRGRVITQINDALRPGEGVVVTCRTGQYRDTVRPPGGAKAILAGAAAIQLQSLDARTVAHYLRDDAGDLAAAARWAPVLAELGTSSPVGEALGTPLMVSLARTIYLPRAGEQAGHTPEPAELCSPSLTDRRAVEAHLFDGFIPAVYRPGSAGPWTAREATASLVFLAGLLERTIGGTDLAWWQLTRAVHLRLLKLGASLAAGLITAVVAGFLIGWADAIPIGIVAAVALALTAPGRGPRQPSRGVRFKILKFAGGLAAGLVLVAGPALAASAAVGAGSNQPIRSATWNGALDAFADGLAHALAAALLLVSGLLLGLGSALMLALVLGLQRVPGNLRSAASPRAVFARDRRAALVLASSATIGIVSVFVVALGLVGGLAAALVGLGIGSAFGLETAILISVAKTAWPSYQLARGWLALRRRLPWRLMDFMADAHRRGILRQAGPVYQFSHIELQHRLAGRAASRRRPRRRRSAEEVREQIARPAFREGS
jgi:hypothetical protein